MQSGIAFAFLEGHSVGIVGVGGGEDSGGFEPTPHVGTARAGGHDLDSDLALGLFERRGGFLSSTNGLAIGCVGLGHGPPPIIAAKADCPEPTGVSERVLAPAASFDAVSACSAICAC